MQRIVLFVVYRLIMRPLLRFVLGIKWDGESDFRRYKQFILVANHNSHIDTMALMSSLTLKQLQNTHPVAASTYFGKNKWLGWLSTFFVNTILIERSHEGNGPKALDVLHNHLQKGHSLIYFPEGSRGKPEELQSFHKGIGVLLQQNPELNYIPVWIQGTGKILPKGAHLPVPFEATLTFGKPRQAHASNVDAILDEVKNALLSLKTN